MFYRNFFAALCFLFLGLGLAFHSPHAFWGSMMCGALSRTAVRKKWPAPPFARELASRLQLKGPANP
jgi:Sec-independent protein secretion pathway component TatC